MVKLKSRLSSMKFWELTDLMLLKKLSRFPEEKKVGWAFLCWTAASIKEPTGHQTQVLCPEPVSELEKHGEHSEKNKSSF